MDEADEARETATGDSVLVDSWLMYPQVRSLVFTVDFDLQSSKHIIMEGLLRDVPIGRLESGESREIETGLCFLAYGRYEISAEAKVVGSVENKGLGRLTAMV
ncbi:hypothetical protein C8R43DRAFT_942926 [Mycena crocata]|nr:hypothetical protein C8R43DRAFT_942926 [Mycena crocata]